MKLGSSDRLKSIFRHLATMTVLCGTIFVFWPAPSALAQAPAGPLPAHEQTDVDAPPRAQASSANSASQESGPAKTSGVWKLNKDQSDDPRKAMQAAGGGGQGGGGGRGGWGGGGSGGGTGAGGGRGRGGNGGRGGPGGGMMAEYDQLTIGQTGSAVKITGSSGRILAQSASSSGDNSKSQSGDSLDSTPAGVWQGSQYVVTTQTGRGKTTRSYGLSQDGTQLILRTRIASPRLDQPVTFRQVYDPVKASSSDQ